MTDKADELKPRHEVMDAAIRYASSSVNRTIDRTIDGGSAYSFISHQVGLRDALIASQAAEIDRLTACIAEYIVQIDAQAAEIERLETLVIDITDLDLIDHDRRKEIASLRGALQMTSDWFAAAQAEAELYLIPDNDCNQYWFVSRMLWHLDGPTQRALKAAIDAAMEEPKP